MSARVERVLASIGAVRVDGHRRVPSVPTNEQRVQSLRARLPVQFGNATFLRSPAERYAAEQSAPEPGEAQEAFSFKYGVEA